MLGNHPSTELARLAEVSAQVIPMSECLQWLNADGSLKAFRVTVKDKQVWRTIAEAADLIAGFDQTAHEWATSKFGNVDGINEHEEYMAALNDAYHIHASLMAVKRTIKSEIAEYESGLRRIDNIQSEIAQLLS